MPRIKVQLADNIKRVITLDSEATKGATLGANLLMPNGQIGTPLSVLQWLGGALPSTPSGGSGGGGVPIGSLLTTKGDLLTRDAQPQRLPIGAEDDALRVNSVGLPEWRAGTGLTKQDDTNVTLTLNGNPTVSLLKDVEIQVGWTGELAATRGGTGHAAYNIGDILYADTPTSLETLGAGPDDWVLTMYGGFPAWAPPGSGGGIVDSVVAGDGITVDDSDIHNPIVAVDLTYNFSWTGTHDFSSGVNFSGEFRASGVEGDIGQVWSASGPGLAPEWRSASGGSIDLGYSFNTSTANADPGNKHLSFNFSGFNATALYINETSSPGFDANTILSLLQSGNRVYIQQHSNAANAVVYQVTGAGTHHTGYWEIPVVLVDSRGSLFANNTALTAVFILSASGTGVNSVTEGTGIDVDNTDPDNPVVSLDASVSDLNDVNLVGLSDGDILVWDNSTSQWVATAPASSGVESVTAGTAISVNNVDPANPVVSLNADVSDLNDVNLAGLTDGDILIWDQSTLQWVAGGIPPPDIGISDLNDVDLSGLTDGDILIWDQSTTQWVVGPGGDTTLNTAPETRGASFSGGISAIVVPTNKVPISIREDCRIAGYVVLAQSPTNTGTCTLNIYHSSYGGYPPSSSICASNKPTIASGVKTYDTTLTGWSTTLAAGDTLLVELETSTLFTAVSIFLALVPISYDPPSGFDAQDARDAVGATLTDTATVNLTYSGGLITADVIGAVFGAKAMLRGAAAGGITSSTGVTSATRNSNGNYTVVFNFTFSSTPLVFVTGIDADPRIVHVSAVSTTGATFELGGHDGTPHDTDYHFLAVNF